jgi:hypothetical protein
MKTFIKNTITINNHKVFEAYVQQRTPAANRIFWYYGPGTKKDHHCCYYTPSVTNGMRPHFKEK